MERLTGNTVLRRKLEVTHHLESENQLAVFDQTRSELVVLNATGAAFWDLIDGEATMAEIAREVAEFVRGAPPESEVLNSLKAVAEQLLERGAVEILR
jgi:hypothetical protein